MIEIRGQLRESTAIKLCTQYKKTSQYISKILKFKVLIIEANFRTVFDFKTISFMSTNICDTKIIDTFYNMELMTVGFKILIIYNEYSIHRNIISISLKVMLLRVSFPIMKYQT